MKDGDTYVINGQKVWTSAGHRARGCWLAARTDPEAKKKHHGLSIFLVDMKSPGVTVRPLPTYFGLHSFNEVFFKDVRVPAAHLVGEENKGWYYLMQALAFERGTSAEFAGTMRRLLEELVHYAKETGKIANRGVRRQLADTAVDLEALRLLAYESNWKMSKGLPAIYEGSRDKAYADTLFEKLSLVGTGILGAYSQIDPMLQQKKWPEVFKAVGLCYCMTPGLSIAAGTTDIQRSIVGQFGLQLPKSY